MLRQQIRSLEDAYSSLLEEYVEYDSQVSAYLDQVAARGGNLNDQILHAISMLKVSNQRQAIHTYQQELGAKFQRLTGQLHDWITLRVAVLSLVVAGLAVFLILFQLRIANEQGRIMREQLAITMRQDETTRQLFLRKPMPVIVLVMKALTPSGKEKDGPRYELAVRVRNAGDKSLREFFFHLMVPSDLKPIPTTVAARRDEVVLEGVSYTRYRGIVEKPVFPSRIYEILKLKIRAPGKRQKFLWKIIAEEGVFPELDRFGTILLDPSASRESKKDGS